jgi:hypothetical protein
MHFGLRVRGWRGAHSGSHSSARPRVTRAVEAARMAHAGVTRGMGTALAGLESLLAPAVPAIPAAQANGNNGYSGHLGSATAMQLPTTLMRETTRAAWLTGRRPEDVLEEALADWLASYESAPMALSPVRASARQSSWGEIEETLRALRAS